MAEFEGWAVIDLDAAVIVLADEQGLKLLDLRDELLPVELKSLLSSTDLALAHQRVLPSVRDGQSWTGSLRLPGTQPAQRRVEVSVIPHVNGRGGPAPTRATVLFGTEGAAGPTVVPDPLTGLPTRSTLLARLEAITRRTKDSDEMIAALFFDLDGLKNINDRYGHDVGDRTLIETAQRIASCLTDRDTAVRFGGDEFVVLCEHVENPERVPQLATEILAALRGVDDYQAISASIGIAFSRGGAVEPHELIRRADTAMYRAKARGGSQTVVFDSEMQNRQRVDQQLRSSLLDAISNNGFGVAAQPIFELATGHIRGVELFIRLRDDAPYIANATELFRLAHEHGEAIDAAILGRAIALARTWHGSLGGAAPQVHVNISAQSLASSQFVRRVSEALEREQLRPRSIVFEADCRDLAPAGEREHRTIRELAELGIPIVLDGYTGDGISLAQIAALQPSMVKITATDLPKRIQLGLVRGVSAMRFRTCIKGIESQPMLATAVGIGAFAGQGNALTPVRQVSRINRQLHHSHNIGF